MAENMAANQQDPNFEMEKARREGDAADKALREHGMHLDRVKVKEELNHTKPLN